MIRSVILSIGWFLAALAAHSQEARVVFYNVENLFDTRDDSLFNDEEFLPGGVKDWNFSRYSLKVNRIYKTLCALGEGELPAVIGLCEIENRAVLEHLIYETPLSRVNYRIIHRESKDSRGVDVALLYRPEVYRHDSTEWLTVPLAKGETTREILHVSGRLWETDTIHFYVNHWPSRYGGAGGSRNKRLAAASTLALSVRQVQETDPDACVVIMGDFNDEPGDESLQSISKIVQQGRQNPVMNIDNLSVIGDKKGINGTIKHQGSWANFDQMLVSVSLLDPLKSLYVRGSCAQVFCGWFLLEEDQTYTGMKPFRTYLGPAYHNGFSDHLPVLINIIKR